MYKNFAPQGLGITGRQSELIELALTYAYRGMDIDINDMVRRVQRSDFKNAARFLHATELVVTGFDAPIDLDADDEAFATQLAQLHPAAEIASQLDAKIVSVLVPPATDRLPFNEFFEAITKRLGQMAQILAGQNIRLAVGFKAGSELAEGKEFDFIRTVEGFMPLIKGSGDNVGFLIDTFDWFAGGGTMDQLTVLPTDKIASVRMSGISAEADPDKITREDRTLPTLGGSIDFVAIAKHLLGHSYEGPVTAFAAPGNVRGATREAAAEKAQVSLDEIFRGAGLVVAPRPMDNISDIVVDMEV